ncbi:MAG: uroporphyrinogen decarboxylase family protein [Spirochaetia bacterium]
MTSRERFLKTLSFETVDVPWFRGYAFVWPETEEVWRSQGYEGPELGWHGEGLPDRFGLEELLRVDPWYGPVPEFEQKVIEEDEKTRLYVNHEGILMRELKEHTDTSMPQFVKFPVETPEEFEAFAAERLALHADQRFPADWRRKVASGKLHAVAGGANVKASGAADQAAMAAEDHPRLCWADRWGGFFGSLRNMLGLENLCCAFHDNPSMVERMMEERADAIIQVTEEVLKHTRVDVFWYWEDMAYNHAALIDPKMFRRFAFKHYRRVNDWLRAHGIHHIGLDSDGQITQLIPIWVDAGLTHLWPFEVQSGMDVVEVRRTYGRSLAMVGGIDKRACTRGFDEIHREVDRVMPLVEQGGYVPELDHSVPPNISWPNFIEYVRYVKHRLGRG